MSFSPAALADTPWTDEQRKALRVLASGVVGDPVAEIVTYSLLRSVGGEDVSQRLRRLEGYESRIRTFAETHRTRSAVNRILPGAGGDPVASLASALAMESQLLTAIDVLGHADIPAVVLKGTATRHLDHHNPTDRESGDIDLLVRPSDLQAGCRAFAAAGFLRSITHPFANLEFFHSETFVSPGGTEVDLHHRFTQASLTPTTCWGSLEEFSLGGHTVKALPRPWRFLHALVHQMMNPPPAFRGVNGLLDLAAMWNSGLDLGAVRGAADEVRLRDVTERGIVRLTQLLGGGPVNVSSPVRARAVERRFAAAMDSDREPPGYLSLVAGIKAQPVRRWPSYFRQLLWPTAAYRSELGISPFDQLRHVAAEAIGRKHKHICRSHGASVALPSVDEETHRPC